MVQEVAGSAAYVRTDASDLAVE